MLATAVTASAVHLLNEGGPTKSKTSAAQAACLIAVVSISWDTLDEAIVVANFGYATRHVGGRGGRCHD